MSNDFLKGYKAPTEKKKRGKPSKQVAIRLPMDVYDKLDELSKKKKEPISRTIIKALRYALELPD